jgi:hypothetical protein
VSDADDNLMANNLSEDVAGPEPVQRDLLRTDSDALLRAIDEVRALEDEKRRVQMSSPEFHQRANEIERLARSVFGLAQRERRDGEGFDRPQPTSIDDEARQATGSEESAERRIPATKRTPATNEQTTEERVS